jgi:hypothetical protein
MGEVAIGTELARAQLAPPRRRDSGAAPGWCRDYDRRVHDPVRKRDFTKGALTADGYSGWTTFSALRPKRGTLEIPSIGGTYIIVRSVRGPGVGGSALAAKLARSSPHSSSWHSQSASVTSALRPGRQVLDVLRLDQEHLEALFHHVVRS